jgi:two-component sensor histidine kinase
MPKERALSEALAAKDVLLREVHHRVKNNLQTISSLLHMQAALLPDLAARQALRDAQRRVHSMALIHEQMYGDKDMDEVDFGEYARRLDAGPVRIVRSRSRARDACASRSIRYRWRWIR